MSAKWMAIGGRRLLALLLCFPVLGGARKFYDDDPMEKEPTPVNVEQPKPRKLNEYYDFFTHTFGEPGERNRPGAPIAAGGVNTLGEVPDGAWYVKRHYWHPMTNEELVRGPRSGEPPQGAWKVVAAKTEGVTPGFTIDDARGRRYIIKFDPRQNPEMATAADVIGSLFFYALGYHVPENYIVYFDRDRLTVSPDARLVDTSGKHRKMTGRDIAELLAHVESEPGKGYRAIASRYLPGKILGPFRYYATRRDDPNDIVPHEHRRDLRGLFVFAAWLAHNDAKALNTLDTLIEEDGVHYMRHHLIDFGASLGSDSFAAKSPRSGNSYMFEWPLAAKQLFSLGLYVPRWALAHYPHIPSVGNFESTIFDPEKWKPNYPIPAFENRLPDDEFWAAKQVMAFTDEQIRAMVGAGHFTHPKAAEWLATNLMARRDKIGRVYFGRVLPLDHFRVEQGRLVFDDLAVHYHFTGERRYEVSWFRVHNEAETLTEIRGARSLELPPEVVGGADGAYFAAAIQAGDSGKAVTVYLRKRGESFRLVGVERAH
jgi:hypothetical protein